ncbi:restriction endonuclease subunit S [Thermococcus sp.]|uniref:restriction endonuclease subunit S n=1 Tax=Thermococcus sp. TaxID=35749 RepID=UPI0025E01E35|nr:restriction endonuclease subunit S [Thermococcus sp.]
MSETPDGWKRVKLGDIGEIKRGASPRPKGDPRYFGGAIPWIKISDLSRFKEGIYLTKTEDTVTEEGKRRSVYLPDGSLIVSNSGTVGEPAIIFTGKGGCIHDGFITIKPREASEIFLYYLFEWKKQEFQVMAQANTQGNMNTKLWAEVKINLPPLPEQRKIAEVLSKVDSLIEKTEKIIEKYERIKRGLAQDLLTRGIDENGRIRSEETHEFKDSPVGRIPKEWKVVKLGELGEIVYGDRLPESEYHPYGDSLVYGSSGIIARSYRFLDTGAAVVLPRKGTITNVFYVSPNQKFWVIDTAFYIKPTIDAKFLYYGLQRVNLEIYNEATGVPSLSRETLRNILLAVPYSDEEQRRIAQVLSQVDNILEKERRELEKLKRLKRGLMSDLLSGKVRVTPLLEASK